MFMAIAVESSINPLKKKDYRIWYLELDNHGKVVGIGTKTKEQLIESLFLNYQKTGASNWRAFRKNFDHSTPIEVYDFIGQSIHQNTHFGELPTLAKFQETLKILEINLEVKSIAC